MRDRGDLAGFAATGEEGATATESVAACICLDLRRQYAISLLPSLTGPERSPLTWLPFQAGRPHLDCGTLD